MYSYSSWPPGRLTCVNFLLINVALRHVTLGAWCCALHSTQHSVVRSFACSLAPLADSCAVLRSANMLSCSVESERNSYFVVAAAVTAVAAASILTSLCYKMPNEQTQSATHTHTSTSVCFLMCACEYKCKFDCVCACVCVKAILTFFSRATPTNAKLVINKAHVHFIGFHIK